MYHYSGFSLILYLVFSCDRLASGFSLNPSSTPSWTRITDVSPAGVSVFQQKALAHYFPEHCMIITMQSCDLVSVSPLWLLAAALFTPYRLVGAGLKETPECDWCNHREI